MGRLKVKDCAKNKKILLEAYIKIIPCRRVTIYTLSKHGKILSTQQKENFSEPVVLNVARQEIISDKVKDFTVVDNYDFIAENLFSLNQGITSKINVKCPFMKDEDYVRSNDINRKRLPSEHPNTFRAATKNVDIEVSLELSLVKGMAETNNLLTDTENTNTLGNDDSIDVVSDFFTSPVKVQNDKDLERSYSPDVTSLPVSDDEEPDASFCERDKMITSYLALRNTSAESVKPADSANLLETEMEVALLNDRLFTKDSDITELPTNVNNNCTKVADIVNVDKNSLETAQPLSTSATDADTSKMFTPSRRSSRRATSEKYINAIEFLKPKSSKKSETSKSTRKKGTEIPTKEVETKSTSKTKEVVSEANVMMTEKEESKKTNMRDNCKKSAKKPENFSKEKPKARASLRNRSSLIDNYSKRQTKKLRFEGLDEKMDEGPAPSSDMSIDKEIELIMLSQSKATQADDEDGDDQKVTNNDQKATDDDGNKSKNVDGDKETHGDATNCSNKIKELTKYFQLKNVKAKSKTRSRTSKKITSYSEGHDYDACFNLNDDEDGNVSDNTGNHGKTGENDCDNDKTSGNDVDNDKTSENDEDGNKDKTGGNDEDGNKDKTAGNDIGDKDKTVENIVSDNDKTGDNENEEKTDDDNNTNSKYSANLRRTRNKQSVKRIYPISDDEASGSDEFDPSDEEFQLVSVKKCGNKRVKRDPDPELLANVDPNLFQSLETKCKLCSKVLMAGGLHKHMLLMHKEQVDKERRECPICKKAFTNPVRFEFHKSTHVNQKKDGRFECPVCKKDYANRSALFKHRRIGPCMTEFECDKCGLSFSNERSLHLHNNQEHQTHSVSSYSCPKCKKPFFTKGGISRHLKRKLCKVDDMACHICHKVFSKVNYFERHMLKHKEFQTKTFQCDLCGNFLGTYHSLQKHLARHKNIRNYVCKTCEKRFLDPSTLDVHMRSHSNIRPFICELCGDGFSQSGHLMRHKLQKHDIGTYPFVCQICEKGFVDRRNIEIHTRMHERRMNKVERRKTKIKKGPKTEPETFLESNIIHIDGDFDISNLLGAQITQNNSDGSQTFISSPSNLQSIEQILQAASGDPSKYEYININTMSAGDQVYSNQQAYINIEDIKVENSMNNGENIVYTIEEGVGAMESIPASDLGILAETAQQFQCTDDVTYFIIKKEL